MVWRDQEEKREGRRRVRRETWLCWRRRGRWPFEGRKRSSSQRLLEGRLSLVSLLFRFFFRISSTAVSNMPLDSISNVAQFPFFCCPLKVSTLARPLVSLVVPLPPPTPFLTKTQTISSTPTMKNLGFKVPPAEELLRLVLCPSETFLLLRRVVSSPPLLLF